MNQPKPTVFNYNDYLTLKAENADLKQLVIEAANLIESQKAELEEAEIVIESALTLLTPRPDGTISVESARQILFDWGEPQDEGKERLNER